MHFTINCFDLPLQCAICEFRYPYGVATLAIGYFELPFQGALKTQIFVSIRGFKKICENPSNLRSIPNNF